MGFGEGGERLVQLGAAVSDQRGTHPFGHLFEPELLSLLLLPLLGNVGFAHLLGGDLFLHLPVRLGRSVTSLAGLPLDSCCTNAPFQFLNRLIPLPNLLPLGKGVAGLSLILLPSLRAGCSIVWLLPETTRRVLEEGERLCWLVGMGANAGVRERLALARAVGPDRLRDHLY